jgi:integrase
VVVKRTSGDGGLSKKLGYYTDSDGQRLEYSYWQASREVPAEMLPRGLDRKRVTGSGKSKTEALARLAENWEAFEKGESNRGRTRLSGKATVRTLFAEWDANNKAGAVSATMAWKYEGYFRNHIVPHIGDRRLDSLREEDLLTLFNHTLASKKDARGRQLLGGPARRNIYMALSGCLKFAVRQHYLAVNPLEAVKPPRKEKPKDDIDTVLTDGLKVLEAIQTGDGPDTARWLLAFLGLRKGERLGLSWTNVRGLDTDDPKLVIDQQLVWDKGPGLHVKPATKSKKSRTIPLTEPWVSVLRRHRERWEAMTSQPGFEFKKPEYADLVFVQQNGAVIHPNDDNDDWKALLTGLGITPWRGHLTRHLTAILLAEMEPAIPISTVMAILGHASEAMSIYYAHVDQGRVRAPMEAYGKVIALDGRTPTRKAAIRRRAPRKQ